MTKSFYPHLLTMSLIHAFLFIGTWQVINSPVAKSLASQLGASVIQLRVSAPTPTLVKKVVQEKVVKTTLPTPKVIQPVVQETAQATPSVSSEVSIQGTGSGKFTAMDIYKAELRATIDRNKYYPTMSRRLGQTGTVVIAFTLLEDGNIVNIRIEKPSQYERLNVSALDAVKKVERFKPIPKEIGEIKMDIKVPVKFVTI